MITIVPATSAEYYTGGGGMAAGTESYYLDAVTDGEPPGRWSGSGADDLGLVGEVDAADMQEVYGEFVNPLTGARIGNPPRAYRTVAERLAEALEAEPNALPERVEELRREFEASDRSTVLGLDATFSVPKSVTVAHVAAHRAEIAAHRAGDLERAAEFRRIRSTIEDAIHAGNAAALQYAAAITTSRAGRHGGHGTSGYWVNAPGLVTASFFQHTSRNGDPQLHVHNVILNRAYCTDGKARAIDARDLMAHRHALGAVADRVLEERLAAAGFDFELRPDGVAREMPIVPEQITDLFSSRRRQVTGQLSEAVELAQDKLGRELTDLELYRLRQRLTLATRRAKDHSHVETTEEMVDRWAAETVAEVGTALESVAGAIQEHLAEAPGRRTPATWSPDAVIAEAVAACGEQRAAWTRADLMLELHRRLPTLGLADDADIVHVLDQLAERALTGDLAQQVSGHALPALGRTRGTTATGAGDADGDGPGQGNGEEPGAASTSPGDWVARALEANPFCSPSEIRYASVGTLTAETALRQAALVRGRHRVDADELGEWLDARCPTIGADQRAAVTGIATSDAALTVLVGPAGTGKSFTAGALAGAWSDLAGGRVVGLAVSQAATLVLRADGIETSRNVAQWLGTQERLTQGTAHDADREWLLGSRDIVLVDEASMVTTRDLETIRAHVEAAGARLVLTGDPHQLGAIEAGGVLGLLDGHAETYTLADVRRFHEPWERQASLDLRAGNPEALATYDAHGRLLSYDSPEAALDAAAQAAVADRLSGRSVVVVTGTNEQAATVSANIRAQLVALGLVEETGILLERDQVTAGIGDLIAARRNDYRIGVTNRLQYVIRSIEDDGALLVEQVADPHDPGGSRTPGAPVRLPAPYVLEDVQLGYASTVHAAQGLTVDAGHLVTDGDVDDKALYVALTRGGVRNTAHVITATDSGDPLTATREGSTGATVLGSSSQRPSAQAVLRACLDREDTAQAATVRREADLERLASLSNIAGRIEAITRAACRERMERHLDDLVADGVLDERHRAELCADQASEHLSRLLRATEQLGHDPRETLAESLRGKSLSNAHSVAQVLSHRITHGRPLVVPITAEATVPADIDPAGAEHLRHLQDLAAERRAVLGTRTATQPPPWALEAFGPVPEENTPARRAWEERAGIVAAHREATGWDDPHRPIGSAPGISATERRASYAQAWTALGRPETELTEAAMTEGQLLMRVRAMRSEETWAPAHATAALQAAEADAEQARQDAVLTEAAARRADELGDRERAAQLQAEAAEHHARAAVKQAAIGPLTLAVQARAEWAASTAVTLDRGRRAYDELCRREIDPEAAPDRITAEEWLAAEAAARQADDPHRVITEADLRDPAVEEHLAAEDEAEGEEPEFTREEPEAADRSAEAADQGPATANEGSVGVRQSAAATTPEPTQADPDPAESTASSSDAPTSVEEPVATDENSASAAAGRGEDGKTTPGRAATIHPVSPAYAVVPRQPSAVELQALVSAAQLALHQVQERASADAAHSDPVLEERHGVLAEADRHRREAADLDHTVGTEAQHVSATSDETGIGDD